MRIVLIELDKDTKMKQHKAAGIISIQVIEGQMIFTINKKNVKLGVGQMLSLHENIPHCVVAIREIIFLFTLTTTLL